MSRHSAEHGARREVAEGGLEFLLMEVVRYFLYDAGAARFAPPEGLVLSESEQAKQEEQVGAETRRRLEALGKDVGMRLVERYAMERDRLEGDLEVVKFVCKDFWERTFKKQADILKTNYKGLFVMTDNNFRWLARVGGKGRGKAEDYVLFPCGLICGALTRLGVKCRVTAEIVKEVMSYKVSFSVQVIQ